MLDNNNPAQPEAPASTTEQLLRLLGQLPKAPNGDDDDALNNPELEQLFGSLAKGLEQGVADSALATPTGEPLTLEALAASLGQPLTLGEIPAAQTAREAAVACPKCGSANPAATRFCGMCGQGLGTEVPKASGNGAKPAVAASDLPTLAEFGGRTSSSTGLKMALLGALVLVLGLVVYQQLWRLPLLTGAAANSSAIRTSSKAAEPPAEAAPAPAKQPASVTRAPDSVAKTPSPVVKPSKAAPPTVIRRNLPQPRPPLPSAPVPLQIPLPVMPLAAAAEPVRPPPVEKAPAAAPVAAAPEPKPARISQVSPGVLISKVNPQYPPAARAARVQGAVVMHAIIGTDGTIQQLRVISGNPLLVNAAMAAVKQWRYRPYLLGGTPVEGETDITVNFKGE